jgi:hypothetical protein
MMFLKNLHNHYPETNLAFGLKNSLFFEMSSQSEFQWVLNNPG